MQGIQRSELDALVAVCDEVQACMKPKILNFLVLTVIKLNGSVTAICDLEMNQNRVSKFSIVTPKRNLLPGSLYKTLDAFPSVFQIF